MSRSALWRSEGKVQERERNAQDTYQNAIEEGRNCRARGLIPLWGPDDTFNLNPALIGNIVKSPYFIKCCNELKDWTALVDEIYYEVKHMEPWTIGASKMPSTAICLVVRLLAMRCTEKQMKLMLDHADSPYIRCIGFLYLRYASDPSGLWQWVEPYLYDEESVRIEASHSKLELTVGTYVRKLLNSNQYYGTLLPRLPVIIERDIKVKLLQAERIEDRAKKHFKNSRSMDYFRKLGSRVRALYGDEENAITWYDGVVDRVITKNAESGIELSRPKFLVTFPEYGNTETVALGELDFPSDALSGQCDSRGNDRDRFDSRTGDRDNDRDRNQWNDDRRGYDRRGYDNQREGRGYQERGYNTRELPSRDHSHGRDSGRDWQQRYPRDDDRNRHGPARSRSKERDSTLPPAAANTAPELDERELMEEVLRREREESTARGKSYGVRPPGYKTSLAVGQDSREQMRPVSDDRDHNLNRQHQFEPPQRSTPVQEGAPTAPTTKTAEEMAAVAVKKRKLMAKYG